MAKKGKAGRLSGLFLSPSVVWPSAKGAIGHKRARSPSRFTDRACPPLSGTALLRLLGTPAQINRLTADGHTPAEPLFCMGAATPHRWSPSARPLPEPETSHGGGATVATAPYVLGGIKKDHPLRSGNGTPLLGGPTAAKRPRVVAYS